MNKVTAYELNGWKIVEKETDLENGDILYVTLSEINGEWVEIKRMIKPKLEAYAYQDQDKREESGEPSFFYIMMAFVFLGLFPPAGIYMLLSAFGGKTVQDNPIKTGLAVGVGCSLINKN